MFLAAGMVIPWVGHLACGVFLVAAGVVIPSVGHLVMASCLFLAVGVVCLRGRSDTLLVPFALYGYSVGVASCLFLAVGVVILSALLVASCLFLANGVVWLFRLGPLLVTGGRCVYSVGRASCLLLAVGVVNPSVGPLLFFCGSRDWRRSAAR